MEKHTPSRPAWFRVRLLGCLLAVTLAGCGKGPSSHETDALYQAVSRKEIRVGYLVFEPCVARDLRSGEMSGVYVDIVNQIAKDLDVKVTWVETTLATFSAGLQTRQFDFSVGPTFVTIPRAAAVSFTQPVNYVGNSGVVRKGGPFHPHASADLNRPGLNIAVLQGQVMDEYCQRNLHEANLVVLGGSDLTAPLAAVSAGRADVGLMNSVTVANYAKAHPEVEQVLTGEDQLERLPLAWATRAEDVKMLHFLDSAITYVKSTGRLAEYQNKYTIPLLYDIPVLRPLSK